MWCATYADCVILYWNQQKYQRTVKLLPHSNVGVIHTAPGYLQYAHTCSVLEKKLGILAMPATIDLGLTPSMQSPETSEKVPIVSNSEGENPIDTSQTTHEASQQESPDNQPFTFEVEKVLGQGEQLYEDLHPEFSLAQQELLHWHYCLNHLSFARIQNMAKQQLLPACLAKCTLPFCSGCTYGKMTRCTWQTKAPYATVPKVGTKPGQYISVDQLDATVPGFIAQIKGSPMIKTYNYVTIFVDHYSKLGYIHLQETLTSDDTVKA